MRLWLGASALVVTISGWACGGAHAPPRPPRAEVAAHEIVDHEGVALFRERDLEGSFVLLDERRAVRRIVGPELAATGFLPASTFKIPNTLIALETAVIQSERFSLPWDGTQYEVTDWNRDHDVASAMKYSVVWFYRELARRIGAERMNDWMRRLDYGNRNISGPIDSFWLDGPLRISPRQQVEFLRRLHERELPVSRENAARVEHLIVLAEHDGVVVRGKTGLTVQDERAVGWLVGFVERGLDRYAYALLVLAPRARASDVMAARKPLATHLLARSGALPQAWQDELR